MTSGLACAAPGAAAAEQQRGKLPLQQLGLCAVSKAHEQDEPNLLVASQSVDC